MALWWARMALHGAGLISEYAVSSAKGLHDLLKLSYTIDAVQAEWAEYLCDQTGGRCGSACGARAENAR